MKKTNNLLACLLCLACAWQTQAGFYNVPVVGRIARTITNYSAPVFSYIGRHKIATTLFAAAAILGTCYWQRKFLRDSSGKGLRNIALKLNRPRLLKWSYNIMTDETSKVFKAQDDSKKTPPPDKPTYEDNKENFKILQTAIRNCDIETIKKFHQAGWQFDKVFNKYGEAPDFDLSLVIDKSKIEQIKHCISFLQDHGYSINAQLRNDKTGESLLLSRIFKLLLSSTEHEKKEELREFITELVKQHNANIDPIVDYGKIYLHECAQFGDQADVQMCLDLGAKLHLVDGYHKTVLHYAILNQNKSAMYQIVTLLLSHPSASNLIKKQEDPSGAIPLHLACKYMDFKNVSPSSEVKDPREILAKLVQDDSWTIRDSNGASVLHYIAENNDYGTELFSWFQNIMGEKIAFSCCLDKDGSSPLERAAKAGNYNVFKGLLACVPHLANAYSDIGTPLALVASNQTLEHEKKVELCNLLIDCYHVCMDQTWQTQEGKKSIWDIVEPNSSIGQYLNQKKQEVETKKKTELETEKQLRRQQEQRIREEFVQAVQTNNVQSVNKLLQTNLTLLNVLDNGNLPIHCINLDAEDFNSIVGMVQCFTQYDFPIDLLDKDKFTLLQKVFNRLKAAQDKQTSEKFEHLFVALTKLGAKIENQTSSGQTILHEAVENGDIKLLKFILDTLTPAQINCTNIHNETALQYILNKPDKVNLDIIRLLRDHGAKTPETFALQSELERAVVNCDIKSAEALIIAGASLNNAKNRHSNPPLHWLAESWKQKKFPQDFLHMIDFLVKNGVHIDQPNNMQQTFLYKVMVEAINFGDDWDKGHFVDRAVHIANHVLKQHRANINAQDENGNTLLHQLVALRYNYQYGPSFLMQLLLELKASLAITNNDNKTPLDCLLSIDNASAANTENFINILRIFHKNKAPITKKTNDDGTMLLALARGIQTCNAELVQLLLELGAEVKDIVIKDSFYGLPPMSLPDISFTTHPAYTDNCTLNIEQLLLWLNAL